VCRKRKPRKNTTKGWFPKEAPHENVASSLALVEDVGTSSAPVENVPTSLPPAEDAVTSLPPRIQKK
jgi:hypothetical protein